MQFVSVKYPDTNLLKEFIDNAGSSLKSFRYFQKRPLEVIQEHLCTFLLVDEKTPVAYGHLDVTDEETIAANCGSEESKGKREKTIWLGIAVSEKHTGKGLGLMMMNQLISFAKQHKVPQIKLSVDNENTVAIQLYEKLGFKLLEKKATFGFYILNLN